MKTVRVFAIVASLCACGRANPEYEVEAGATEDASGRFDASSSEGGAPFPDSACAPSRFAVEFSGPEPDCSGVSGEVFLDDHCVVVTDWGGGRLRGSLSSGCELGACPFVEDRPFELSVDQVELPLLFGAPESNERRCAWIGLHGASTGEGTCSYSRVEIWDEPGGLRLALGEGPPDDHPSLQRPIGGPIPIITSFYEETSCGELATCDRAGFRNMKVGVNAGVAHPGGEPTTALIPVIGGVAEPLVYTLFNWGLQYDLGCRGRGYWAIVPEGFEDLFD